ncbi:adenine phosphoribosyltransferase [Photorhabdus caribbeanensis]|uniref:adenine phosphoribosyltransferase n=1 Tax=Photorhabdus caribbeanensis TaxID=1004165 RepID=UPI001BD1BD38|nr:adenine phosphoribosyltransferase [Photorhabdus caribbeanensis]MBS9422739.1 adenine phosphoribosyltransferase [Photorhabdus caribbeanensis]
MLLEDVYENARVVNSGKALTTVNEFTDQLPALRPQVLIEVAHRIIQLMDLKVDKIVTEEDKGAPLATAISLFTGIPLAMARWYPYGLDEMNNTVVQISSEYFEGKMYLNGIEPGDRVSIIDDTLSTGGAVISLIEAVQKRGGEIKDVICAVEKVQNNGKNKVKDKTGIEVKTIMKIYLDHKSVKVID